MKTFMITVACLALQGAAYGGSVSTPITLTADAGRLTVDPSGSGIALYDRKFNCGDGATVYHIFAIPLSGGGTPYPIDCEIDFGPGNRASAPADRGNPEFSPDGHHVILQARNGSLTCTGNSPGQGLCYDVWISAVSEPKKVLTGKPVQVTAVTSVGGVLHPQLSHVTSGGFAYWAQRTAGPNGCPGGNANNECGTGFWEHCVASVVYGTLAVGKPGCWRDTSLGQAAGVESNWIGGTWGTQPGSDDHWLYFAGNAHTGQSAWTPQIMRGLWNGRFDTPAFVRVEELTPFSPKTPRWTEHVKVNATNDQMCWGDSTGTNYNGTPADAKLDLWCAAKDSTGPFQLTFFNQTGSPEFTRKATLTADSEFTPDGSSLVVYENQQGVGPLLTVALKSQKSVGTTTVAVSDKKVTGVRLRPPQ